MSEHFFKAGGVLKGTMTPPGDKSISHRAVMFGALSEGRSHYRNFLEGDDCLRTMQAFQAMGISIERKGREITLEGQGLGGLKAPAAMLDVGNSGTSIRLLMGILAGQRFEATLGG